MKNDDDFNKAPSFSKCMEKCQEKLNNCYCKYIYFYSLYALSEQQKYI